MSSGDRKFAKPVAGDELRIARVCPGPVPVRINSVVSDLVDTHKTLVVSFGTCAFVPLAL